MPHLFALGLQVALEGWFGGHIRRDALDNLDAHRLQRRHLLRIVGDQADGFHAHHLQHRCRQLILPAIRSIAKLQVRLNGIQPLVLQFVRLELRHQANTAALLGLVEQNAGACIRNRGQRQLQLLPAVAAQRVEDVSRQALRVDAHNGRCGLHVAHHQRNRRLDSLRWRRKRVIAGLRISHHAFKPEDAELTPPGREVGLSHLAHGFEGHAPIISAHNSRNAVRRLDPDDTVICMVLGTHPEPAQIKNTLVLITLLIELGVAASYAAALARSNTFKNLLLRPHRSPRQTIALLAIMCLPLAPGVWMRIRVPNFYAADLSFEATILMALLLGTGPALFGGAILALPALSHGEYWAFVVNVAVATVIGIYGRFTDPEDAWSFSPMIDLGLYQWVTRTLRRPHFDRQIMLLVLITAMQFATSMLSRAYPRRYFELHSNYWLVELAICACAPVVVGIPLKIWNAIRTERKLEEQSRLLMEARLDALQRQINPHFLFNT